MVSGVIDTFLLSDLLSQRRGQCVTAYSCELSEFLLVVIKPEVSTGSQKCYLYCVTTRLLLRSS